MGNPEYFIMAHVPETGDDDIFALDGHTDRFVDVTGVFHNYDEDLPSCVKTIAARLQKQDLKAADGDRVVLYGLVPLKVYNVKESKTFTLELEKTTKKIKGGGGKQ